MRDARAGAFWIIYEQARLGSAGPEHQRRERYAQRSGKIRRAFRFWARQALLLWPSVFGKLWTTPRPRAQQPP